MKRYRVWIEIEEHDDETDEYQSCDAPGASLAEYNTLEEAYAHAEKLTAGITYDDVLAYITERCLAADDVDSWESEVDSYTNMLYDDALSMMPTETDQ